MLLESIGSLICSGGVAARWKRPLSAASWPDGTRGRRGTLRLNSRPLSAGYGSGRYGPRGPGASGAGVGSSTIDAKSRLAEWKSGSLLKRTLPWGLSEEHRE